MAYRILKHTFSRNFKDLNTYVRRGKQPKWEVNFTREQTGIQYEEDKQAFRRFQDYDEKHGTNITDFYEYFHFLWFWDNVDTEWSKELRNNRRHDVLLNLDRYDPERTDENDDDSGVELTHNPSVGLNNLNRDSDPIEEGVYKSAYTEMDYQYNINPYSNAWTDAVIEFIDRERGATTKNELDVGVIRLPKRKEKCGIKNTTNGSLYLVTVVLPTQEVIRRVFTDGDEAKKYIKILRNKISKIAFSSMP